MTVSLSRSLTLVGISELPCCSRLEWTLVTSFRALPGNRVEPFRLGFATPLGPEPRYLSLVLELPDLESSNTFRILCGGIVLFLM